MQRHLNYRTFLLCLTVYVALANGHTFHGAAMAPNSLKGWVVRYDTGCVYYTLDCGLTWVNQSFLTSRYFMDVFFLNEQKGWIISDQGFIFNTTDGGDTWVIQYMGIAKAVERIFFIDDSCGWICCFGAIIGRTIHGGYNGSWEQILLPYPPFHVDTIEIWDISFANNFKGWFCTGNYPVYWEPDTWFTKGQGYIAKSNDSGLNWQLLRRDTIYDFFDIKMLDTLNGFVIGGNDRTMSAVVMRTSNGGNTWQNVTIPVQAKYLRSLKFVGNHAWTVGHNGTIIHSNNGGNSWTMQTSNINTTLYDVDFSDTLHGLVAGDSYVLYTHDGGATWHIANVGIEEEIAMPSARNDIYNIQISPNPFLSQAIINLTGQDNLAIYDINGRVVKTFSTDYYRDHRFIWNGKDNNGKLVSAGVYFAIVKTDKNYITAPLIYVGK